MMMAQTSSAQREPSMEEILASIRRIIEDSDNVRQPLEEVDVRFSQPIADPDLIQQQVEAFRTDLNEPEQLQPDVFIPPLSAIPVQNPLLAGATQNIPEQLSEMLQLSESPSQASVAAPSLNNDDPSQHSEIRAETQLSSDDDAIASSPFAASAAAALSGEAKLSLISDQAGRQVAAAFGELSEAFAASRRRSFDEMAEEMLRPMLQDWLDNNLPTLVERLVREEIERVARGG